MRITEIFEDVGVVRPAEVDLRRDALAVGRVVEAVLEQENGLLVLVRPLRMTAVERPGDEDDLARPRLVGGCGRRGRDEEESVLWLIFTP